MGSEYDSWVVLVVVVASALWLAVNALCADVVVCLWQRLCRLCILLISDLPAWDLVSRFVDLSLLVYYSISGDKLIQNGKPNN